MVFESSHVQLNLWLLAVYLMCSSKKSISAHQDGARGYAHKNAVMNSVQRGGSARSFHVNGTKGIRSYVDHQGEHVRGTRFMTDEAGQYVDLKKHFTEHEFVRHGQGEYGRGPVHTNTVEGSCSVFKRGMKGSYQTLRSTYTATSRSSSSATTTG